MNEKICPNCHYPQMKNWHEMTDEQKFLAERLPLSATFSIAERQNNLFCPRCWHEQTADSKKVC